MGQMLRRFMCQWVGWENLQDTAFPLDALPKIFFFDPMWYIPCFMPKIFPDFDGDIFIPKAALLKHMFGV